MFLTAEDVQYVTWHTYIIIIITSNNNHRNIITFVHTKSNIQSNQCMRSTSYQLNILLSSSSKAKSNILAIIVWHIINVYIWPLWSWSIVVLIINSKDLFMGWLAYAVVVKPKYSCPLLLRNEHPNGQPTSLSHPKSITTHKI